MTPSLHAMAWMAWLLAIMVVLTTTRNPLYMGLVLLWIAVVGRVVTRLALADEQPAPVLSPVRFGLFAVAVSALFNALTVHIGSSVLFALPAAIPLLGGIVTLEAMIYGALNGVVLAGLFAAFSVINRAVPVRSLIRIIPRAYYSVAVVVAIAITFVPATIRQLHQIREAQMIRGLQVRGVRGWAPLFVSLLTGGMERALQLAEAMVARGFASGEVRAATTLLRMAALGGLMTLVAGWLLRLVWNQHTAGLLLMVAGAALILGALWTIGRRRRHTTYRPEPWRIRDSVVVAGSLLAAAGFWIAWPGAVRASIYYYPYPKLLAPTFSPLLALTLCGLLAPALALTGHGWRWLLVRHD